MIINISECHLGWTHLNHTGKCYKHDPTKRNWTEALESCRSSSPSSTLASVHDDTTNDFLTSLSGGNEYTWLGGYQDDNENWHWADGSNWNGFNNWASGEPSNYGGSEDHLGLNFQSPGTWNDFSIEHQLGSICQYDPYPGKEFLLDQNKNHCVEDVVTCVKGLLDVLVSSVWAICMVMALY